MSRSVSGRCSLRTSWVGHCIPRGWYIHLVRYAAGRANISILLGLAAPFKGKTFKMFSPTSAVLSHVFVRVGRATFPETSGDCCVAEHFVIIRGVTWKLSHQRLKQGCWRCYLVNTDGALLWFPFQSVLSLILCFSHSCSLPVSAHPE